MAGLFGRTIIREHEPRDRTVINERDTEPDRRVIIDRERSPACIEDDERRGNLGGIGADGRIDLGNQINRLSNSWLSNAHLVRARNAFIVHCLDVAGENRAKPLKLLALPSGPAILVKSRA